MIKPIDRESRLHRQMEGWRRDFHAYPEVGYEEIRTANRIAKILTDLDLIVETGLGKTGVVATLEGRKGSGKAIALRADMDALNMQELNKFPHCSKHQGIMHACGHDGHTAMLLGAASRLSENPDFDGTVHFVFQPAEEGKAGARAMIEDGLFERFPVSAVYGLHNWPALNVGEAAVHEGPVMASYDTFDIEVSGKGGHSGMPNLTVDPISTAGQLIVAIQTIVSRNTDPMDNATVSITQVHGGTAYNVIPDKVCLRGTVRTFDAVVRDNIEIQMRRLVKSVCDGFGCCGTIRYERFYPATINDAGEAQNCLAALRKTPGIKKTHVNPRPSMASEDFATMLELRPGSYIWLGQASDSAKSALHSPEYDFNDEILSVGANYWITLVQHVLNDGPKDNFE